MLLHLFKILEVSFDLLNFLLLLAVNVIDSFSANELWYYLLFSLYLSSIDQDRVGNVIYN